MRVSAFGRVSRRTVSPVRAKRFFSGFIGCSRGDTNLWKTRKRASPEHLPGGRLGSPSGVHAGDQVCPCQPPEGSGDRRLSESRHPGDLTHGQCHPSATVDRAPQDVKNNVATRWHAGEHLRAFASLTPATYNCRRCLGLGSTAVAPFPFLTTAPAPLWQIAGLLS